MKKRRGSRGLENVILSGSGPTMTPTAMMDMIKKDLPPKVTQVRYARLQTTGQFENERLEIVVEVQEGDGRREAKFAKGQVLELLGIRPTMPKFEVTRGHGPVCICDECM